MPGQSPFIWHELVTTDPGERTEEQAGDAVKDVRELVKELQ